jgi:hypothetical protein
VNALHWMDSLSRKGGGGHIRGHAVTVRRRALDHETADSRAKRFGDASKAAEHYCISLIASPLSSLLQFGAPCVRFPKTKKAALILKSTA